MKLETELQSEQGEAAYASREQDAWSDVLGTNIEVPPLPSKATSEVQKNLERLGFELRFIPKLDIGTLDELQRNGQERFLDDIQSRYPNWRRYETLSRKERKDHSVGRNLKGWFWRSVKDNETEFPQLNGTWVAVETMPKPSLGESYKRTGVSKILGLKDRFNISWHYAHQAIEYHKSELLDEIGLSTSMDVRMLEAVEWNLLANREGWGATGTYEWTNTELHDDCVLRRITVGSSFIGDVANTGWMFETLWSSSTGLRVAVVLGV